MGEALPFRVASLVVPNNRDQVEKRLNNLLRSFKQTGRSRLFTVPVFRNNNPTEKVVNYQMTVHLFGNTSSPAIATSHLVYKERPMKQRMNLVQLQGI